MSWFHIRKRKKKEPEKVAKVTTEAPKKPPEEAPLAIGNLQIIGQREEQQDAFYISSLSEYPDKGLLAVVLDGMGGMNEGGAIARDVLARIRDGVDLTKPEEVPQFLTSLSGEIYGSYLGQGGTTTVMVFIYRNLLRFWSIGDSDLFLQRNSHLYEVNTRHEYQNLLLLKSFGEGTSHEAAFSHPEGGSLYSYIGTGEIVCDNFVKPFLLKDQDVLLICTDGVSDTLTLEQLKMCLELPPQEACMKMEAAITTAENPKQDNATAIVIHYHETPITTEVKEDA